jgi:anti-sigma B factor antagonist
MREYAVGQQVFDCGLRVALALEHGALVARPSGELDAHNCSSLPATLLAALNGDPVVIVDLADVTFVDTGAVRVLLICQAQVERQGARFHVRHAFGQVARMLELTGTSHLLGAPRGATTPTSN